MIQPTSFVIQSGSLTTLLGPSGCGKTTLLRMIAGLETPDSGEIWFENRCVFSSEKKINIPPEKRGLGFVFQDFALWDDFQAMADNGMTVPGANKAALEAVTTGEVGILVAGVDYNAYSSKNKGEPLDIYYPAGGTIVNPRPAMILKTAPNMDNAKAFVDYLFSDEAQQLVANAYLLPGRTDIKCDKRSNLEDIPQITPDWDKMMAEASDDAAKINQICGASNG